MSWGEGSCKHFGQCPIADEASINTCNTGCRMYGKSTELTDVELNGLVFKAIVPKALRPETTEEIDAMLDAIGGEAPSEDTVQRMLRKVRGEGR